MTDTNVTPIRPTEPPADYSNDDTAMGIRAYLASMRPLDGCEVASVEGYWRGLALIERMALESREDRYPDTRLTAAECADVVNFMGFLEPLEPANWWKEPEHGPNHVYGYHAILRTLQVSLEAAPMEVRQ